MRLMHARIGRGFGAVAAIAIAITVLAVSMTGPMISTTTDFSIFNSRWNGTSRLAVITYESGKFAPTFKVSASNAGINIAQLNLQELGLVPSADALTIIGPTDQFTAADAATVGSFVGGGGLLLLADDFGSANSLLSGIGSTSRFSSDLVMDLAFEKQPEFSVCFDLVQDEITKNVSTLLLNYPSSIIANSSTTDVIARTSVASWLDVNGDKLREPGEPTGPFPILARERYGTGTIILLSDPSVLINGMRQQLDNAIFSDNLMAYVSKNRAAVFFDESHRKYFDPVTFTMRLTGPISTNAKIAVAALAFILSIWILSDAIDKAFAFVALKMKEAMTTLSRILPGRRRKPEEARATSLKGEELLDMVEKAHPDWRKGLLRYLLRENERQRTAVEKDRSGND